MTIQDILNHCMRLSYRDLENFAGANYLTVYNYMASNYDGEKVNTLLIGSILTCIAADGKLSDNEWKFISSFIGGYTYDEAFAVAGEFYNDKAQGVVRDLLGMFPNDIKKAYISLCLAVLAVDKRVDDYEFEFLNAIL